VVGANNDFNTHTSVIATQLGIHDLKALTQYAPILLSDDEPQITRLYEVLMSRSGLNTVSVPNGVMARDYLLDNPVSLVIAELMKPHFTGLQLLQAVRENPATIDVPFMIVTATPEYESRLAFKALGGDTYLTKPIDARQFTQTVTHMLSSHFSKRSLAKPL
jgi:DNA-binding response OmpR family regulator